MLPTLKRPLLILLLIALAIIPLSFAEELPTPTPTPEVILPDSDLKSPRAAVATFLTAMDGTRPDGKMDVDRAVKTLDTSDIPELVRAEKARDTAVKLYTILTYRNVTASKVPSWSSVDAIQILDSGAYGIYLERSGPNWRFSKTTVAEVPAIFREIEPNLSRSDLRVLSGTAGLWLRLRTYVPESLKRTTFLLEDWQWLAGASAVILLLIFHLVVVKSVHWFMSRFVLKRFSRANEERLNSIGKPIFVVLFTVGLQLFLSTLDLEVSVYGPIIAWVATVRAVAVVVLSIQVIELVGERIKQIAIASASTADDLLVPLIQRGLWLLAVALGIVQVLTLHGVNVSGLVAGLGLGGLAFALAAKDTVENIFGSIAILIDRPFKVGEYVIVGGVGGSVERIGLRTTRLRTPDNSLVAMPNSKVIASHVENLGARAFLRTFFVLTLPYTTPVSTIEAFCAGVKNLLGSHPLVKQDAVQVSLTSIAQPGLGITIQFFLATRDANEELRRKEEIFLAMLRLAEKLEIQLALPSQNINIESTPTKSRPLPPSHGREDGIAAARQLPVGWNRIDS